MSGLAWIDAEGWYVPVKPPVRRGDEPSDESEPQKARADLGTREAAELGRDDSRA